DVFKSMVAPPQGVRPRVPRRRDTGAWAGSRPRGQRRRTPAAVAAAGRPPRACDRRSAGGLRSWRRPPLLLLYDAKAPHGHNIKYFNDLLIYSSNISIGLF